MRVLFTGASSFTGYWFVKTLVSQGHEVIATFSQSKDDYNGLRGERINGLAMMCEPIYNCTFGEELFLDITASEKFDVLCHHAADVRDYHSATFDVARALTANTKNIPQVIEKIKNNSCEKVVLTGSIFETGEGKGSGDLPAFSPYGLSKALTADVFEYYAEVSSMRLGKFVIPNPFGPFEEPRFTAYLMKTWARGDTAGVRTPAYIRDNIHVDLLAQNYVQFVTSLPSESGLSRLNPSGYISSMGEFAQRFSTEVKARSGFTCDLSLAEQVEFLEPLERVNLDPAQEMAPEWSENEAWDAYWEYYEARLPEMLKG